MFAQGSPPEWDDRKTETTRFDRIVRSAFVTHGNFPSSPDVYDGRWEIAEALYIHITEGYGGTPAAVAAQVRLSAPPRDRLERTSRVELPVFGTLYGFWLGIAVPAALGADGPEAYGAGLLIGGPVGLFASRAMARARPMSEGQARAISWGGIWGAWQGGGWSDLLGLGQDEVCDPYACYDTGDSSEELFASMIVGGLAGIVTGALVDPDGDSDAVLATALIAGNVGLLAGGALAGKYDMSRSSIRMINLGTLAWVAWGWTSSSSQTVIAWQSRSLF